MPVVAVVTNIDREHLEAYRDFDDLKDAFVEFANKVPFYGAAVLCLDEDNVQDVLPRIQRRHLTYGFSAQADVIASEVALSGFGATYRLSARGESATLRLRVPGRHSVLNSLAAVGVALELGVRLDAIVTSEEAGVDKPAPAPFEIALERLGRPRGDVWVVGDAEGDLSGARAIGATPIQKVEPGWVTAEGNARCVFDDFAAFAEHVRRLGRERVGHVAG